VDSAYTTTYEYDDYNRLTGAMATAYTRGYSFDEWGNLKTVTATGGGLHHQLRDQRERGALDQPHLERQRGHQLFLQQRWQSDPGGEHDVQL
jgi:YD repeat-containing protein